MKKYLLAVLAASILTAGMTTMTASAAFVDSVRLEMEKSTGMGNVTADNRDDHLDSTSVDHVYKVGTVNLSDENTVELRAAAPKGTNSKIEVYALERDAEYSLEGVTPIATLTEIGNGGDWNTYRSYYASFDAMDGEYDIYIKCASSDDIHGYTGNFDYIAFGNVQYDNQQIMSYDKMYGGSAIDVTEVNIKNAENIPESLKGNIFSEDGSVLNYSKARDTIGKKAGVPLTFNTDLSAGKYTVYIVGGYDGGRYGDEKITVDLDGKTAVVGEGVEIGEAKFKGSTKTIKVYTAEFELTEAIMNKTVTINNVGDDTKYLPDVIGVAIFKNEEEVVPPVEETVDYKPLAGYIASSDVDGIDVGDMYWKLSGAVPSTDNTIALKIKDGDRIGTAAINLETAITNATIDINVVIKDAAENWLVGLANSAQ